MIGRSGRPDFGFVEWFRPGEHDRVLRAIDGMRAVGASSIRTQPVLGNLPHAGGRSLVRLA
jgi:CDP-paratose 2-epimerase